MTRALFINEIEFLPSGVEANRAGAPALRLLQPLRLATPAYLLDRDERELELLNRIEQLTLENQNLRAK